jgi:HAE1 family hydrophobic/amphiphilic exporter-1
MEQEILMVDTILPAGSPTREVTATVAQAEEIIREDLRAEDYLSMGAGADVAGGGITSFTSLGGLLYGANSTSFAETTVFLEKGASLKQERDKFNQRAGEIQGAEVTAYTTEELTNNMGMGLSSLAITLSGKDKEEVIKVGKEVLSLVESTKGISGINSTIYDPVPHAFPRVNYERAQTYGISSREVEGELSMMREDQMVSFAQLTDREYEVYVRGLDLKEKEDFEDLYIGREKPILLTNIAEITEIPSPPLGIRHYNQDRAEFINATISGRDKGQVVSEVEDGIKTISHPGVEVEIGGMEELMEENFRWMIIAIVAAVILLYFTMTVIFRSFINSGLIMLSLPLAIIGALLSLFVLGRPIGVVGLMGIVMLEGIVLTNAIVLLVFVEQLRKRGMSIYDALVEGGRIRLRPILMTALTTMFALLPLSFGGAYGGVIITDMAIVVIGGLITSTALTLIVIPVVYRIIHRE